MAQTTVAGIGYLPFTVHRNDLLLVLVAMTELGMGVETALAHLISGSIKPAEMIPVVFGISAGVLIMLAIWLRWKTQKGWVSSLLIIAVAGLSIAVGLIGSSFHWNRVLPPSTTAEWGLRWDWIIYAPPIAGPLSFAGVGLLAIIALFEDTTPESGCLTLPKIITLQTPLSQTRQFFWLVALGLYAATLSAFLDHGRTSFEDVFTWLPVFMGLFASILTTLIAIYETPTDSDFLIFFWVMILMILMGIIGVGFHINADLPEGNAGIVVERFIRGAPIMAPMLFAIMGSFGLITLVGVKAD